MRRASLKTTGPSPAEQDIADWLGRLKLLHGVPFHYLVAHAGMLPMESIRFFCCNTTWLHALQEGACSLGRSTSGMEIHDQSFADDLRRFGMAGARRQRVKLYAHLTHHMHGTLRKKLHSTDGPPGQAMSGFLLRSDVVSGWKGLQVEAFDEKEQTATMLRMDHLSPHVLLCLFEGIIKSVRIHEEPEVLHFGVDRSGDTPPVFEKSLRYPVDTMDKKTGREHKAGTAVYADATDPSTADPVKIALAPHFRAGGKGVIRVFGLAQALAKKLEAEAGYVDKDGKKARFTAAEFALEMVEGVEAVNFNIQ